MAKRRKRTADDDLPEFRIGRTASTLRRFRDESQALGFARALANENDEPVDVYRREPFRPARFYLRVRPDCDVIQSGGEFPPFFSDLSESDLTQTPH